MNGLISYFSPLFISLFTRVSDSTLKRYPTRVKSVKGYLLKTSIKTNSKNTSIIKRNQVFYISPFHCLPINRHLSNGFVREMRVKWMKCSEIRNPLLNDEVDTPILPINSWQRHKIDCLKMRIFPNDFGKKRGLRSV
jgi:hypothetical protein